MTLVNRSCVIPGRSEAEGKGIHHHRHKRHLWFPSPLRGGVVRLGEAIREIDAVAPNELFNRSQSFDFTTPTPNPSPKGEGRARHILKAIPSRVRLAALIQRISAG